MPTTRPDVFSCLQEMRTRLLILQLQVFCVSYVQYVTEEV